MITTWLFDLDNTLYSPHADVFPQIHRRMSEYIIERLGVDEQEAERLREYYFHTYGTTMRGLMLEHGISPEQFLEFVHNIDLSVIHPSPRLDVALKNLNARKLIFTNADRPHAMRIINRLGIAHHFEDIFDIVRAGFACKPDPATYKIMLDTFGLDATACCMVDDMECNLAPAAQLGMKTLWIRHDAAWQRKKPEAALHYPHCHYVTDDLIHFLENSKDLAA